MNFNDPHSSTADKLEYSKATTNVRTPLAFHNNHSVMKHSWNRNLNLKFEFYERYSSDLASLHEDSTLLIHTTLNTKLFNSLLCFGFSFSKCNSCSDSLMPKISYHFKFQQWQKFEKLKPLEIWTQQNFQKISSASLWKLNCPFRMFE